MVSRTSKFRGSRTHGRGKKAGRGAGLRGGRGNAGLHKHKYLTVVKHMPNYFGRYGFKRPQSVIRESRTMNLSELELSLESLRAKGVAESRQGRQIVDLKKLGIDKLLGSGRISTPVDVIVDSASKMAKQKLEKIGGKLIVE